MATETGFSPNSFANLCTILSIVSGKNTRKLHVPFYAARSLQRNRPRSNRFLWTSIVKVDLNLSKSNLFIIYHQGIRAPTRSITGEDLPLARTVSYTMFQNIDVNDRLWNLMSMQYGQIMTHDMGMIDGSTQSSTCRSCDLHSNLRELYRAMPSDVIR